MKIVDNFELISSYIKDNPPKEKEFYFVTIFIRRIDGHDKPGINGSNKNRLVRCYYIKSNEEFLLYKDEMITLSESLNARVYFYPSKRNFKEVGNKFLQWFPEVYLTNPEGLRHLYNSTCGKSYVRSDRAYLIDVDCLDSDRLVEIKEYLNKIAPEGDKLLLTVPTLHGFHLISRPFNTNKFKTKYPDIDIHKNNPTLLYFKSMA